VQHSTDQEPGIRQNPRFAYRSGSGNPDSRVNHPDLLRDEGGSSQSPEQTEEHPVMVYSWSCKVSSEIHINGRRVSGLVREDKGKTTAPELRDRKDPKRAHVVLSKGREVVRLGYSRVIGVAAKVTDKREKSGNHDQVNWVSQNSNTDRQGDRVGRVSPNSSTDR
jgi:hypothetical protein